MNKLDIKLETKELKSGIVRVPYVLYEPPYIIVSDKYGTRKMWTKDKIKIILYYLWRITRIGWFLKKYIKRKLV